MAKTVKPTGNVRAEKRRARARAKENPFDAAPARPLGFIPCIDKELAPAQRVGAAVRAIDANPANETPVGRLLRALPAFTPQPEHLALLTTRYWKPAGHRFKVGFMESVSRELATKIVTYMNEWAKVCNLTYTLVDDPVDADLRVTLSQTGYWSYIGTDILSIPKTQPTMCLQGFSLQTPDSEYMRVVVHEAGHTNGFIHEHMRKALVERLDVNKTIMYFQRTQGWDRQTVIQQVLTPADEATLTASAGADQLSIMCYQLPGSITTDGRPITGGSMLDETDKALAAKLYPRAALPPVVPPPVAGAGFVLGIDPVGMTVTLPAGWKAKTA